MATSNKRKWIEVDPLGWVIFGFLIFALGFLILNPQKQDSGILVTLVPVEKTVIEVPGFQEVTYFTVPEPETATPATTNQKRISFETDITVLSESQEGETGTSSWTLEDHFRELLEKARVEIWNHPYPVNCEVVVHVSASDYEDPRTLATAHFLFGRTDFCLISVYKPLVDAPIALQLETMVHELGHILLQNAYPENEHDPFHSLDPESAMHAWVYWDELGNILIPQSITPRDRELYNSKWGGIVPRLRMPALSAD